MKPLSTAIAEAAHLWCNSEDHPYKLDAVEATLTAPNQFTSEALEFAIDQQMSQITESTLRDWIRGRLPRKNHRVAVINAGNVPFVGLQDLLAVLLCGHSYLGVLSRKSPYLLQAFARTVHTERENIDVRFVDRDEVWSEAEAIIATGSDVSIMQIRSLANANGIAHEKCLFRSNRYGIAILDGQETTEDWENLALDILLHEGMGCRSVALVFAPAGLEPDHCLRHLAKMRGLFPAHSSTSGRLAMHRAYLAAINNPHAYGSGLEFLISKGTPEVQVPGHVRWVEYNDLNDVTSTIEGRRNEVQCIVARDQVRHELPIQWNSQRLGTTQRPPIDWQPDGIDTIDFLCGLE